MIRVVIVDDEPLALRQLEGYVRKVPYLQLVASCLSAAAAQPYLEQADVLYLDIEMPDQSGLEFVRSLEHPPLVVFTTAYPQYALEGFQVHAADYLLKPFGFQTFEASAARLRDRLGGNPSGEMLSFKTAYKVIRVPIARIRYAESMSEYLKIHLAGEDAPLLVLYRLRRLAEDLPPARFVRIHRSYLVNLSLVRECTRNTVVLEGGTVLPVGDMYRAGLQAALGIGNPG
ncbi:MAG: response regulator transcription factor [Bacteroidales bacterium]|nr:response regulator transcription factor [Bacteroidales bacterium]